MWSNLLFVFQVKEKRMTVLKKPKSYSEISSATFTLCIGENQLMTSCDLLEMFCNMLMAAAVFDTDDLPASKTVRFLQHFALKQGVDVTKQMAKLGAKIMQ